MTHTVIHYLWCEAPRCEGKVDCPGVDNMSEARRVARQYGWRVRVVKGARRDYCPDHAEDEGRAAP